MTEIKVIEAAKLLGRHPGHVAKMIRDGKLKATKRGKTWWLDEAYVKRVASTLPPSEVASSKNLVNGRLPANKITTDKAMEIASKHKPEDRSWRKPPTKKAKPHTTAMQRAIEKHEKKHNELMARIANMGKVTE